MNKASIDLLLRAAMGAAHGAAAVIEAASGHQLPEVMKGERDFATAADLAAERAALAVLNAMTPDIPVLGEEFGDSDVMRRDLFWVVDPIDGTLNFAAGLPLCAAAVALVRDGTAIMSVISAPRMGDLFFAVKGRGAFHEKGGRQSKLQVSNADPKNALVGLGNPYASSNGTDAVDFYRPASGGFRNVVSFGLASLSFCWTASGQLGACAFKSNNPWDIQPGKILIEEAGGIVMDWQGLPLNLASKAVVAGSRECVDVFLAEKARARIA